MHTLDQLIRKSGFKNGLMLGAIALVLNILSFYIITSPSVSALVFILAPIFLRAFVPFLALLFFSFQIRKNIGGLWTFKQATTGIFILLITAYFFNLLGKDVLFDKVVEPTGVEKIQVAAINAKTANMREKGAGQDKIEASIADMKKDFVQGGSVSLGNFITENVFIILFLFVFALIFASLIRNAEYVSVASKK